MMRGNEALAEPSAFPAIEAHWVNSRILELDCGNGYLLACWDAPSGYMFITDMQITEKRQGTGKSLLREARTWAEKLEAQFIMAVLISRESLDSMVSVFGSEAVEIDSIGEYQSGLRPGEDSWTRAFLRFRVCQE